MRSLLYLIVINFLLHLYIFHLHLPINYLLLLLLYEQEIIAHCLDIPANRVVCKTKRIGGGFGGKETKSFIIAVPCAVAAVK